MENNSLLQIIVQTLSVIDGLSVSLIIGAVTILAILEITRVQHQEIDRGTTVARQVLGLGILAQLVYRAVDFILTSNLIINGEMEVSDLPAVYLISLVMTVAAVVAYTMHKAHKLQTALFVFLQASLWYTMFILSQVVSRSVELSEMSAGALTLLTLIVVILLLLILDSIKRYYHKNKANKK